MNSRVVPIAVALLGSLSASAAPSVPASPATFPAVHSGPVPLPESGLLVGAYVAPDEHNGLTHREAWRNFEALLGRPMDVERVYYNWEESWPTEEDEWSRDQGRILYLSWNAKPTIGACTPWGDIAAGLHDAEIDERAAGLVAFAGPVIFTFHHEPANEPPGGGSCGTSPEYIAATRRIIDRFRDAGVANVSYAETITALGYTNGRGDEFYAGDDYIDIIAADGYNWHGCPFHPGPWRSFESIFTDFHEYGVTKGKPLFIAEYGTGEDDQFAWAKAQWFSDVVDVLKRWPEVKGASYFNVGGGPCARYVDSSPQSLQSYQAFMADPYANPPIRMLTVTAADFSYSPGTARVQLGVGMEWSFEGPSLHTVTDATGLNLFDSGERGVGETYAWQFLAAGGYRYRCSVHAAMRGLVSVLPEATPGTGGESTVFTVTWATDNAPTGHGFDVQILRPGSTDWQDWRLEEYLASGPFVADGGPGTYAFRSRYRDTRIGEASRYSPSVSILVTGHGG